MSFVSKQSLFIQYTFYEVQLVKWFPFIMCMLPWSPVWDFRPFQWYLPFSTEYKATQLKQRALTKFFLEIKALQYPRLNSSISPIELIEVILVCFLYAFYNCNSLKKTYSVWSLLYSVFWLIKIFQLIFTKMQVILKGLFQHNLSVL